MLVGVIGVRGPDLGVVTEMPGDPLLAERNLGHATARIRMAKRVQCVVVAL